MYCKLERFTSSGISLELKITKDTPNAKNTKAPASRPIDYAHTGNKVKAKT